MAASKTALRLLLEVARTLQSMGSPAHRVEDTLHVLARKLGIEATVLSTPTSISIHVGRHEQQRALMVRGESGSSNLKELCELHDLIRRLFRGEVRPDQALREVRSIRARAHQPRCVDFFASAAVTSGAAAMFGGHWAEIGLAGIIGVARQALVNVCGSTERLARGAGMLEAFLTGLLALAATVFWPSVRPEIPLLAGLILALPGVALTLSMRELAEGHLVSGTARAVGAVVTLVQLGVGVGLARAVFSAVALDTLTPRPTEWSAITFSLTLTAVALNVQYRSRRRDLPTQMGGVVLAFVGAALGREAVGAHLGAFLGSWLLGTYAHVVSRMRSVPAAVILLPGLVPIVPGSLGLQSFTALLSHDVLGGVDAAFAMALVVGSLAMGLYLAHITVSPYRSTAGWEESPPPLASRRG